MKNKNPICRKCDTIMKIGISLQNALSAGLPDFANVPIGRGQTVSRSGIAELVTVWKCPNCGHSFEKK